MTSITVNQNKIFSEQTPVAEVANSMREAEFHVISFLPWDRFPYKPEVKFALVYGADCFCLQFEVAEKFIRCAFTAINEPVYKDSCVEFFLSLDEGATYYNFEFNCIGTVLGGFGNNRHNRESVPEDLLSAIKTQSVIQRQKDNEHWQLTVMIPFAVIKHYKIASLKGRKAKANFYKCGDELPDPHYLSWADIKSAEPNFHLPQFFGEILFK